MRAEEGIPEIVAEGPSDAGIKKLFVTQPEDESHRGQIYGFIEKRLAPGAQTDVGLGIPKANNWCDKTARNVF